MADAPNDYREPKVTTAEKSSGGSIVPWILLALGVLALLAWLLGFFGPSDDVAVTPVETTVEEPAVVAPEATPDATPEAEAPAVVVPEATTETPAAPETPVTPEATTPEVTPEAAPDATDVETQIVPITPVDPETPAVDGTAPTDN